MFDFRQLQEEVSEWARRNFGPPHGSGYRPLLGVQEEVGELAHAHLKAEQGIRGNEDHESAKKDAVGDIVIYLADYCSSNGIDMQQAVEGTWNEVKRRDWKKNPDNANVIAAQEHNNV